MHHYKYLFNHHKLDSDKKNDGRNIIKSFAFIKLLILSVKVN